MSIGGDIMANFGDFSKLELHIMALLAGDDVSIEIHKYIIGLEIEWTVERDSRGIFRCKSQAEAKAFAKDLKDYLADQK